MNPLIQLDKVAVRYRVPHERIPTFKEYAIRWLKRDVKYQNFWALKNINLKVERGEALGIIGPNGAGKSTMLKVIARVLQPTRGRVRVQGRIAPLLELGAGFDPELTGRENIYLNGTILGFTKQNIASRLNRIVAFAGLDEFIDAPLRTYSTGMVARLGFSVATDVRPEILIIDEVLSVGDAEFQQKSFERIQSFQRDGTTILLVSHSLDRVSEMCSRAIWLQSGEIQTSSTASTVIAQYLRYNTEKEAQRLEKEQGATKEVESERGQRWGSHKLEITHLRITDQYGNSKVIFQTGEPLAVEMTYHAHQKIQSPVFGIAIHRQDGLHITGPNTEFSGYKLPILQGSGIITYKISFIPLLDGLYSVSAACTDQNDSETFDYHHQLYSFRVANHNAEVAEKYGLMTLRGEWHHEERIPAKET